MSLILNHRDEADQIASPAKDEMDRFFTKFEKINLSKSAYTYYEVLFRQLMGCEQAKTGYRYENEPICIMDFCGKMKPEDRIARIEKYLKNHSHKSNYGFMPLTFEKKKTVRKIQLDIKKALENLDFFRKKARESLAESELELFDFDDDLQVLQKKAIQSAQKKIKKATHSTGFLSLSDEGVLSINVTRFEFISYYSQLYSGLLRTHCDLSAEDNYVDEVEKKLKDGTIIKKVKQEKPSYGVQAFIADKLNYEFGKRLGIKINSEQVRSKFDSRLISDLELLPSKLKAIDLDFVNYLFLRR